MLTEARAAFDRRDWTSARAGLRAAWEHGGLEAGDLSILADSAWWLGDLEEAVTAYEEAYRLYVDGGLPEQAATAALDIAVSLLFRGEEVGASGWLSRAQRLLRDRPESIAQGRLIYLLEVEAALNGPDLDSVVKGALKVQDIGRRQSASGLVALGVLGEGRARVRQGRTDEGMRLLDEAMVATVCDEVDLNAASTIYCHLIAACHELDDLHRMQVWTDALTRWCEQLPKALMFTGICRVHRAQLLLAQGTWEQAEKEATQVRTELSGIHVRGLGDAHYLIGEVHRLRGDLAGAEAAYRQAHEVGHEPQPGLALLRLAQGRTDAALASVRTALAGQRGSSPARARLHAAQVEIALAADELDTARAACDELDRATADYPNSGLEAAAVLARGRLAIAENRPDEALPVLRDAYRRWQELNAPYDAAKARLLLATAYRALGDEDAAALELDAATAVFTRLGAALESRRAPEPPGRLTAREAEVLALVAEGRTNREVAAALVLSEKTVARHLSNIFTKLGLASRTAAAAYAFEHGISRPHG
jgi:DNA-binding NarL/FixJ family response regulator